MLTADDDGRTIQWTAWPAISLTGAFDQTPSTTPILTIRPVRDGKIEPDFAEGGVACDVSKRAFRCRVPAIPFDARIAVDGFAPQYLFDFDPTIRASLGSISLKRGNSLSGFVQMPRPALPTAATVSLEPEMAPSPKDRIRLAFRSQEAKPNERGFFQFSGIPAGRYTLSARTAGFSVAKRYALELDGETELALEEPLIILPLSTIEIGISPPVSSEGKPWRVSLSRYRPVSEYTEPVAAGETSVSGWWSHGGLDQGSYHVTVSNDRGEPLASEAIELTSEKDVRYIRFDPIRVEGKIFRAGTPVSGSLTFRHASGRRQTMMADLDGDFEGVLPTEGAWDVAATFEGLRSAVRLDSVTVRRPDDGSAVKLRLEVPAGELTGAVKDATGKGVPATVFLASGGDVEAVIETETDGRFLAWGVRPGTVTARAVAASSESEEVRVEIGDDRPADVTLVLESFEALRGIVLDPEGAPIAGAAVRAWSPGRPARRTITGPSGGFEIKVLNASSTILGVLTPSYPISFFPARGTDPLELRLSSIGSILQIRVKRAPPWPFLLVNGTPVAIPDLFIPSSVPGGSPHGIGESGAELRLGRLPYIVCPEQRVSPQCVRVDFASVDTQRIDASDWWSGD